MLMPRGRWLRHLSGVVIAVLVVSAAALAASTIEADTAQAGHSPPPAGQVFVGGATSTVTLPRDYLHLNYWTRPGSPRTPTRCTVNGFTGPEGAGCGHTKPGWTYDGHGNQYPVPRNFTLTGAQPTTA